MEPLYGNTHGLKAEQNKALRALYRRRIDRQTFISAPVARELTELSRDTGRRIGLLVDRQGTVDKVVIGDAHRVFLPDLGRWRAGEQRFRGLRLVLTDLRQIGLTEDDLTDLTLLRLDAVAAIAVDPGNGLPGTIQWAYLLPPTDDGSTPRHVERVDAVHHWDLDWLDFISDLENQFAQPTQLRQVEEGEGCILVGVSMEGSRHAAQRSMAELARLAETAGLQVRDSVLQARKKLDGRTVIGTGKLQELVVRSMHVGAEVLVFNRELSPSQLRNIAESTDLKVLDRTQLILDIFAQHAKTKEGRLQVELAQLRYRAPRLALMPTAMSRLTGGIGGRGPGETKLEINRRRATERLTRLERQLEEISKQRELRRARRKKNRVPVVSIVGYTNAGKSTLLNRVTRSEVLAEDKLFATLDTTTRRFRFPEEREIILADTVGFIEDLPSTLVQAFKATLEELEEADLLLHVLDASDPDVEHHKGNVEKIVAELGLADRATMLVWNKCDAADPVEVDALVRRHGGIAVSALEGTGLENLLDTVEHALFRGALAR
ncbi:MAG: GTPase HflX [Alphaproteobacteria bacterium]|nr:GTPase HflX [Alphaproteobacteria bacterium]